MKNLEHEGYTFNRVMTAVIAGAFVGLILFKAGVIEKISDYHHKQRVELCGPNLDSCSTIDDPRDLLPANIW